MKLTLSAFLFFLPFVIPVLLQIIYGIKNIKGSTRLKISQITIINIALMCMGILLLHLFVMKPATAKTHDGLAYVGIITIMLTSLILILVIMGIQYFIKYQKRKKAKVQ